MDFEFSPHIAFQVKDYEAAIEFYEKMLGMEVVHTDENETEFRCGPITFYVERSDDCHTFFEFKVDNLQDAIMRLKRAGCKTRETSVPEGPRSYIVTDPYGMRFHLWEEE